MFSNVFDFNEYYLGHDPEQHLKDFRWYKTAIKVEGSI